LFQNELTDFRIKYGIPIEGFTGLNEKSGRLYLKWHDAIRAKYNQPYRQPSADIIEVFITTAQTSGCMLTHNKNERLG